MDAGTSQVNVSTSGISSKAKTKDLTGSTDAVLGQVWVGNSCQPICIPANLARIVSGKTDRITR